MYDQCLGRVHPQGGFVQFWAYTPGIWNVFGENKEIFESQVRYVCPIDADASRASIQRLYYILQNVGE